MLFVEDLIDDIAYFMLRGGQTVEGRPDLGDSDLQCFRHALVREEVHELEEALAEGDLAGVVDAYSDIAVVALGGLIAHAGRDAAAMLFADVLGCNAAKVAEGAITDEDGKIQKPEGWEPPRTQEIIEEMTETSGRAWVSSEENGDAYIWVTKVSGIWQVEMYENYMKTPNIIQGTALEMLDVLAVGAEIARQGDQEDKAECMEDARDNIRRFERLHG